jgi:hypothetical protein
MTLFKAGRASFPTRLTDAVSRARRLPWPAKSLRFRDRRGSAEHGSGEQE